MLFVAFAAAADVALVIDGTEQRDGYTEQLREDLGRLSDRPVSIETFYSNFSSEGATAALDAAYGSSPEVVVAVGPLVSETVLDRAAPPKPTIAALALTEREAPENVVQLVLEDPLTDPLSTLRHVLGSDRVAIGIGSYLADTVAPVGKLPLVSVDADSAPPDLDGVLIAGAAHLSESERESLYRRWADAGVAVLLAGSRDLPDGAFGTFQVDPNQNPISRRLALSTTKLLEGRPASSGSVAFAQGELVISFPMVRELGLSLPFDLLGDAELRGIESAVAPLSMKQATAEAFTNSPLFAGTRARISGENIEAMSATTAWLPQVEAEAQWQQIDPALASIAQPETSVTAGVSASQLLWSDGAATNVRVQRDLVDSRDAELVTAEQDLALDVATAFVNVERANAVIDIRGADIERARLSLKVARQRFKAGDAASTEVSRWEAEVANARAALVQAITNYRSAAMELNRLCGMPVGREFFPVPTPLETTMQGRITDVRTLQSLEIFMAEIAVEQAPELRQLDSVKTAQERLERLADRAWVMPTLAAQGSVSFNIYQTPSDPLFLPGVGEIQLANFPPAYWAVGAQASVPIFSGGQRRVDQRTRTAQVLTLEQQVRELELGLRTRANVSVVRAHAAFWRAELLQEGADAVLKSLESALDAYAAGTLTQTSLTEVRTSALQSQLAANDATFEAAARVYDLLRSAAAMPTPSQPDAPERLRASLVERFKESSP